MTAAPALGANPKSEIRIPHSRIQQMKIGFHMMGGADWHGGRVYLTGLLKAVREHHGNPPELCLLASGAPGEVSEDLRSLVDEVIVTKPIRRLTPLWAVDRGAKRLLRLDVVEDRALRRRGVDVIAFGDAPLGSTLPAVAWLPDFQHVHLPEMFTPKERQFRDRFYQKTVERAARVVLLSDAVQHDLDRFAPQQAKKGRVVRPVSHVPAAAYETDPSAILAEYHLPERFVYLPNQFWKHKNHLNVFRALKVLKDRGTEVFLVCTGHPGDHRHPHYFGELLQEVSRLGLRGQVAFLGLLPREHVWMCMRQSVCLLNPSLFEGYGMSADEGRSLGKQLLLSDIPALREQDPPRAAYFNPLDPEDLADRLGEIWAGARPGPDAALEAEARESLPRRLAHYAHTFVSVVQEAVAPC